MMDSRQSAHRRARARAMCDAFRLTARTHTHCGHTSAATLLHKCVRAVIDDVRVSVVRVCRYRREQQQQVRALSLSKTRAAL